MPIDVLPDRRLEYKGERKMLTYELGASEAHPTPLRGLGLDSLMLRAEHVDQTREIGAI